MAKNGFKHSCEDIKVSHSSNPGEDLSGASPKECHNLGLPALVSQWR